MTNQSTKSPITYGSIIHLENGAADGGYLGASRSVIVEDVLKWEDQAVVTFVFTHLFENRSGSGSWEIAKADGSGVGTPLHYGDKIRLRNMHPSAAYLDMFDWVDRFEEPLAKYKDVVQNGVFTLDRSLRPPPYNAPEAEWTIISADGIERDKGHVVHEGAKIRLICNWLIDVKKFSEDKTYLTTYGTVSDNDAFDEEEYAGEKMFVFVGQTKTASSPSGNDEWRISLSSSSKNIYHLWGEIDSNWLDFGSLESEKLFSKSLVALKIKLDGDWNLHGKVSYIGEGFLDFEATHAEASTYNVKHQLNNKEKGDYPNGAWTFGARKDQKIISIDLMSKDGGQTLTGFIEYAGAEPNTSEKVKIKGSQPATKSYKKDDTPLYYNFFDTNIWEKRLNKIKESVKSSVTGVEETLASLGGFAAEKVSLSDLVEGEGQFADKLVQKSADLVKLTLPDQQPLLQGDPQINQLLNIYALGLTMRTFWDQFCAKAKSTIVRLDEKEIMPPTFILSEIIRHFTIDFEMVQRAIQQRRTVTDDKQNAQSNSLLVTDKFAKLALAPCETWFKEIKKNDQGDGIEENPISIIPITFFGKSIHIRQIPYTNRFVFIGLTHDLTASVSDILDADPTQDEDNEKLPPFELMAIPHEVGHYLYHYVHPGLDIDDPAQADSIAGDPYDDGRSHISHKHRPPSPGSIGWLSRHADIKENPYLHWCEEIFADLYGCLVSGPLAALGIQAVLATTDRERLMMDDAVHPTPIFRPYILSEMLRALHEKDESNYDFQATAMILDANWTAILDQWGVVLEDVFNGRPGRMIVPGGTVNHLNTITEIDVAEAIKHSRELIDHFVNEFFKTDGQFEVKITSVWSQKHESLPKYVEDLENLIGRETALNLVDRYQLTEEVKALITGDSTDNKNVVEVGANAFRKLLDGWFDSGPKSGSGGGGFN